MLIDQISVFVENKSGRLSDITGILKDESIDIRALSIADTTNFGILRLIVFDNRKILDKFLRIGTVGKIADIQNIFNLNDLFGPLLDRRGVFLHDLRDTRPHRSEAQDSNIYHMRYTLPLPARKKHIYRLSPGEISESPARARAQNARYKLYHA